MPLDPNDYYRIFSKHVKDLDTLSPLLPNKLPEATDNHRIASIFRKVPVSNDPLEIWEVFNRRMDLLFAEEMRDESTGYLSNIARGPFGMDLVIAYLKDVVKQNHSGFQWNAAMPKVLRLVNDFKKLTSGSVAPSTDGTSAGAGSVRGRKRKAKPSKGGSSDDGDYRPPKKPAVDDSDLPEDIYDSDGVEITEESDLRKEIVNKRSENKSRTSSLGPPQSNTVPAVGKQSKKKKKKGSTTDNPIVFNSGDESDGETAIKRVREAESKPQAARRGPANKSLQHFKDPTPVKGPNGALLWEFKCKYCTSVRRFARTLTGKDADFDKEPRIPHGFNNLSAHVNQCKGLKAKKEEVDGEVSDGHNSVKFNYQQTSEIMSKFLLEGKLNPAIIPTETGFRRIFAAWILDDDLPWTTGESPMLANLFRYLKINFMLPSDTAVRNELTKIFSELHMKIIKELELVKSKIAFATDTWTNKQMIYSFACTIASFIDDEWRLIERVIDFRPLESKEHEGLYAARAFIESARKVGAFKKMSLAMDNASTNDVLFMHAVRALLTLYDIPEQPDKQIRCLAHILNLVAQAILGALKEVDDCVEDGDESDHFFQHKNAPVHFTLDEDEDLCELEGNRENDLLVDGSKDGAADAVEKELEEEEVNELAGSTALSRLRFVCTKIVSSPQRRQRWWKISADVYGDRQVDQNNPNSPLLRTLLPSRDVRTRWNSTHGMIGRGKLVREAINRWIFETPEYEDLVLRKQDWEELETIHTVLEPFTTATLQLSSSRCPTIPFVLPIYDALEKHLSRIIGDTRKYSLTIRSAVSVGMSKLMKYKSMAVKNHNYILGTALHPYLRAEWFRKTVPQPATLTTMSDSLRATQESSYRAAQTSAVERVQTLVQVVAEAYQAEIAAEASSSGAASSSAAGPSTSSTLTPSTSLASLCDFDFDLPEAPPSISPKQQLQDELQRYFSFAGGQGDLQDPLGWWKIHGKSFPILALMARDFLAIPATSVSVERTFSKSRQVCTDLRSSLRGETIREALLTKLWIRSELFELVPKPKPVGRHGSTRLFSNV